MVASKGRQDRRVSAPSACSRGTGIPVRLPLRGGCGRALRRAPHPERQPITAEATSGPSTPSRRRSVARCQGSTSGSARFNINCEVWQASSSRSRWSDRTDIDLCQGPQHRETYDCARQDGGSKPQSGGRQVDRTHGHSDRAIRSVLAPTRRGEEVIARTRPDGAAPAAPIPLGRNRVRRSAWRRIQFRCQTTEFFQVSSPNFASYHIRQRVLVGVVFRATAFWLG